MEFVFSLILVALLASYIAQRRVNSVCERYRRVASNQAITAEEMARQILAREGIENVRIRSTRGYLADYYSPITRTLHLSDKMIHSTSITALGLAAREVGHALQHRDRYAPLMLRTVSVFVVNMASVWPVLIIVASFLDSQPLLIGAGCLLSLSLLFALIALPAEFDANRRVLEALEKGRYLESHENANVSEVLSGVAFAYVGGVFYAAASLQFLRVPLRWLSF